LIAAFALSLVYSARPMPPRGTAHPLLINGLFNLSP
jgi:hypothetical protein